MLCLLGLACTSAEISTSFQVIEAQPGSGGKAGFTLMDPSATGVWFTNRLQGDAYATNAVAHNGSGAAIGDVDADGLQDFYLCNLEGPNRLYRNLGHWRFEEINPGDAACANQFSTGAVFADVDGDGDLDLFVNGISAGTRLFLNNGKGGLSEVKESGLSRKASATSLALADIDGDGDLDLYCAHYIDVMHLIDPTTRFSVIKRDGQWSVLKVNDLPTTLPGLKGRFETLPNGKVRELPEVHALYRNEGGGRFKAIQFEPGTFLDEQGKAIPPPRDWGLAAMFRDLNGDGAPDLYVCNDNVSPDRIWINSGKGMFRAIESFAIRHTSRSSMGVDFGDINRDGYDDIIVVDMLARDHGKRMTQLVKDLPDVNEAERVETRPQYNRNTLFFGRPDGSYAEAALMAGVAATDWSWCPILIDVDLDGYEDLLVSNGFEFDVMDQDTQNDLRDPRRRRSQSELKRILTFYPRWRTANVAFRNRRDGIFEPMSQQWGFDRTGISFGMALGDLDNDGDLDVVVNNLNEAASVYRNEATGGRVAVRLKGLAPNTRGIGARIRLVGGPISQNQEMIAGGRYLSGDQNLRVFATGVESKPMRLEVRWRNGDESIVTNVQANRIIEVVEELKRDELKGESPSTFQRVPTTNFFFADISTQLGHVHVDEAFDDWAGQPSLPRRLSRLGPGVSWYDLDNDGWEDLIVPSGKGGRLALYKNEKGEEFRLLEGSAVAAIDQTTALGWSDGKGNRKLIVANSNYERPQEESKITILSHGASGGATNVGWAQHWPAGKASIGPMATADVDSDGDLDLFVGGRLNPGRYPEAASSSLWLNEDGELKLSRSHSRPFESLGLVSGATFTDLDGDGRPDLALAIEWGPVRVFRNDHGMFTDVTDQWGLGGRTGWWTGISTGDFDGDGRLDLVVGNWGRNTIYESVNPDIRRRVKLGIFYGDFNSDGNITLIEAWQRHTTTTATLDSLNPATAQRNSGLTNWFPVQNRLWFDRFIPKLASHFPTHQAFAAASLQDMLVGPALPGGSINMGFLAATELQSGILLNRKLPDGKQRFDWVPLPREAQLAPVFSINVGDFDSDGNEDLFLSQNFYGTSELSRDDSGQGLWLLGSGRGTFTAVDAATSGIKIYGEQRAAALADFNHDGRVDLSVSQNGSSTKLYVNQRAKRGLRVTLRGPRGNPDAIGAQMRVLWSAGRTQGPAMGPIRTITAGSGYWSQNAATQVLGFDSPPSALWIRWPGAAEQTVNLEKGALDMSVELKEETK
ncbi:MAG: VCBS repeat-containing protein [Verrucomicrobia subdivision 3 bacterium]|nr:VCBS repeat-containing protein [Limisphaerales bacterium]